jgi:AraC-like DNA-binding protein
MRDILVKALDLARRGHLPLKVPAARGLMQKHPDRHFHFKPELFIQIRGRTIFDLPDERVLVKAGDLCVIPAGLPHKETIEDDEKGPFRNLVIGFYSRTLSMHFAHEVAPGTPDIQAIEFFDTPNLDVFLILTSHLVTTFHALAPARPHILNGLMTALLGMLQNLVETGSGTLNKDVAKVFQAKWLVREQISNPGLNVKNIAEKLNCSPDYLSHLFHCETGEKLIHYIQRIRIDGARMALETTQLYISEIAFSSGFRDPAYFTRVFRKIAGESPQEYRARRDRERLEKERDPKTIYYDHEDYSHGTPRDKLAKVDA